MRSIAELTLGPTLGNRKIADLSVDPNSTKVATTGITDMRPTKWLTGVIKFGESLRLLDQIVYVNSEMVGTKDTKVTLPVTTAHKSITTAPIDTTYPEGTVRNFTIMDNMDTVDFTIVNTDFKKGGIAIGKEIFMTCAVDILSQAKFTIAQDMSDDVDLALASALQDTSITNTLWGGDATQVEDLTAGDVLTTDLIADGKRQIAVNDFVPKFLVISPWQEATLLKDSQFVNASEYGSNKVVMKGEIGEYLGLKIIVTTNTNMYTASDGDEINEAASAGANMHTLIMLGQTKQKQKTGVGLAWKEKPHVDYEYQKDEARHLIFYDQCFTTALIHKEAISLIKVTTI